MPSRISSNWLRRLLDRSAMMVLKKMSRWIGFRLEIGCASDWAKMPVDGEVLEGTSIADESMISGEPIPLEEFEKSKVIAGTVNGTGGLVIRAERVGADGRRSATHPCPDSTACRCCRKLVCSGGDSFLNDYLYLALVL